MRRQVTASEFYAAMMPLDVEISVRGRYHDSDYGTDYRLKSTRALVGQTRAIGPTPQYKPNTEYFLEAGL